MNPRSVSALVFAVLVVVSTVAATAPAAASSAPSEVSTDAADASDSPYDQTAVLALADLGDGDVVAAGQRGFENPNATLMRVDDGEVAWSRTFESSNATRLVDVVATDSEIYFLQAEYPTTPGLFDAEFELVKATDDGDVVWRRSLNETRAVGRSVQLVATDDGVTVAHSQEAGVRLAGYHGGDVTWERTYGVRAQPRSLHETEDGYLLVGDAGYDDPWVLRTTASGRERLNETYTGIDAGRVAGGVPTDDGDVLLVGQGRIGFGPGALSTWAARIDADGHVRWTRVHDAGADMQISGLFAHDDGVVLLGQEGGSATSADARLVGLAENGAVTFDEGVDGPELLTAATRTDDTVTIAGVTGLDGFGDTTVTGTLEDMAIPDADVGADATLEPDAAIDSNGTVYRGQDVRIERPFGAGQTYDLVRLPGEHDEFDAHPVRRVRLDTDDSATVETATLPDGEYVLRRANGDTVGVDDSRITGPADRDDASFEVRSQRLYRVEPNRTFVDVANGERDVALTFDSDRSDYDVYVTADRHRGEAASADELRAAFADNPGFVGVESVGDQPAARIAVDDSMRADGEFGEIVRIGADASALDAGLYDVIVSGVDTRDGGAVTSTRLVVGSERARPLGVELGNETLSVAAGERATTNVTLTNVTNGISALSLAANRTGDPAVRVRLRTDINASRASAGSHVSREEMRTEATDLDGSTPNGTVTVGTLGVEARAFGREPITNGTNTVTFEVQWAVDEDGIPYTVPDDRRVTVEVTDAGNETDGIGRTDRSGDGGGTEPGSDSGAGSTGSGAESGNTGSDSAG